MSEIIAKLRDMPKTRKPSPTGFKSHLIVPRLYVICPGNNLRHQPMAVAYRQGERCCFFRCPFCGCNAFLRNLEWSTCGMSAEAAIAQGLYLIDSV